MLSRRNVLSNAIKDCLKELYSLVQPSVEWDEFLKQQEDYSKKYKLWERFNHLDHLENKTEKELEEYSNFSNWIDKSITECIGPKPFEFYYLPREVMKEICDSYVDVYKLDSKQNLLDIIETLKNYCKEPIIDKYIKEYTDDSGLWHPGYRSYDYPNSLMKEVSNILEKYNLGDEQASIIQDKFFEFLDMAGDFFNWNTELNTFNIHVYLGPSPNSNKEAVIENWKKYRSQDIEIDESKYIEEDDDYDE